MEFMGEGKEGNWEASKHASKKKGKAACSIHHSSEQGGGGD